MRQRGRPMVEAEAQFRSGAYGCMAILRRVYRPGLRRGLSGILGGLANLRGSSRKRDRLVIGTLLSAGTIGVYLLLWYVMPGDLSQGRSVFGLDPLIACAG